MKRIEKLKKTLAAAEQVIKEKPEDHTAYNNRGVILKKLRRYKEAIASFKLALEKRHNYFHACYNLGLALKEAGHLREAVRAFDRACDIKPNAPVIYDKRAVSFIELGNLQPSEEAINYYRSALKDADKAVLLSADTTGHYNRACALARLGECKAALESLKQAKIAKGVDFDSSLAAEDSNLKPLREQPWIEEFEAIIGKKEKLKSRVESCHP